jgi:hypothetical protein
LADLNQIIGNLQHHVGTLSGQVRQLQQQVQGQQGRDSLGRQEVERLRRDLENLGGALSAVQGSGPGNGNVSQSDHIRYIESIPGRRIPFDMLVDIPIGANVTGEVQGTRTISQDGPFVAVARFATFQSAYQFKSVDPQTQEEATFQGRSFGRYRPINSAWDLNDASAGVLNPVAGIAFPGTGAPIVASPTNLSGFRSMEFDGVIEFLNQGAAYPRSNQEVPSSFYTTSINAPFQLGSLDFFERGETLQWKIRPTHVNNPNAGNLSGYAAGGLYPFLASQYDVHEGISDPLNPVATQDPISRLPDGILVIGLHGFRIVQPPGPVRIT